MPRPQVRDKAAAEAVVAEVVDHAAPAAAAPEAAPQRAVQAEAAAVEGTRRGRGVPLHPLGELKMLVFL